MNTGARTELPLHSCRMPERLRDPVSSGTLSSSSPSSAGSHACPESLCMLRSLLWFRNMPASCSPVYRRRCAWHRRPLSERAGACSMRTIMHRARACFVSRLRVLLNHARARKVCISQVWAETHVIEPVSLNCLDQAAKTSLGHCVPPASNPIDLRQSLLPWVEHFDLRVRHSTRSQMI